MSWKEHSRTAIVILLSFATYTSSQTAVVPKTKKAEAADQPSDTQRDKSGHERGSPLEWLSERVFTQPGIVFKYFSYLSSKDLEQAKNVCKVWQELASDELQKRHRETKIVYFHPSGATSEEDVEILVNFGREIRKKRRWSPKVVLLFYKRGDGNQSNEWLYHTSKLTNSDCKYLTIEYENEPSPSELFLYCDAATDSLVDALRNCKRSSLSGCILPKALLKSFAFDIIFPPLDMFLTLSPPKTDKKLFAEKFGWKQEIPIKFAIVISLSVYTQDMVFWAPIIADNVAFWLKLLPEGKEMHILGLWETSEYYHLPSVGNDKDIAVLIFGGEPLHVATFMELDVKVYDDEKLLKQRFEEWKGEFVDVWPQNLRKMAFLCTVHHVHNILRDVLGDDVLAIILPFADHEHPDSPFPSVAIIGFPEL